jgi:hypothetical protein
VQLRVIKFSLRRTNKGKISFRLEETHNDTVSVPDMVILLSVLGRGSVKC